jgi:signal transduction histidine kinase
VQDIEDTRTLVLPDAHRKAAGLAWENDILDTLPLPSTLVRQIMINLLLNAIQAVEPQGRVRCHIYRDSGSLTLLVENDGRHIEAEQLGYLFEPFATGREGGHGLGLWVTYQIVQQLKGEIIVQSQPGETRFIVTLPLEEHAA